MNTSIHESIIEAHQESSPHNASAHANAVVADKVSFVKKHRLVLITIGLAAGGLTVALMASGSSKPGVRDPRLLSPGAEFFEAHAGTSNMKTSTGIVEARVASHLGFRGRRKNLERSVNTGQRVRKGQIL